MKKPIIGLIPLWDEKKESYWMLPGYMQAVEQAGGIPIMLPMNEDAEDLAQLLEHLDGLLFTGGHDVDPALYQEETSQKCGALCRERDAMEKMLFQMAVRKDIPILGICRGLQFINVMCGGSLYQDLPSQRDSDTVHCQTIPYHLPCHMVTIPEGTPLAQLLQQDTLGVNSYHHQAIKVLGNALKPMAFSEDGLIEAIWMPGKKFLWAVQWHPEFSYQTEESSRKILAAFTASCAD